MNMHFSASGQVGQNVNYHECKVDYTKSKVVKWLKVWCNFYVPCTVHTFVFRNRIKVTTESRVNKGIATIKNVPIQIIMFLYIAMQKT